MPKGTIKFIAVIEVDEEQLQKACAVRGKDIKGAVEGEFGCWLADSGITLVELSHESEAQITLPRRPVNTVPIQTYMKWLDDYQGHWANVTEALCKRFSLSQKLAEGLVTKWIEAQPKTEGQAND